MQTLPAIRHHYLRHASITRIALAFSAILAMLCITSCGGRDNGGTEGLSPTVVTVYPVGSASSGGSRLFIPVTKVGEQTVGNLPLVLDTGSAGVTLYAMKLFPSNMVTSSGFVFPAGQKSMSYNGMTVTDLKVIKRFGGAVGNGTAHIGNLGFAPVTFGAKGEVTTLTMPVLFYYTIEETTNGTPNGKTIKQVQNEGVFGINMGANAVLVTGSSAPSALSVCTPQSSTSCHLVSPLRYLQYASGIDTGFALSPATLQECDINTAGSCTPAPLFTIGLNNAAQSGFSTQQLACPGTGPSGNVNDIPICSAYVNATIASGNASFSGSILFDTGNPSGGHIFVPTGVTGFVSPTVAGTPFGISPANGFTYNFRTGTGTTATTVVLNDSNPSAVGINYFTNHSFFINFTQKVEGWK